MVYFSLAVFALIPAVLAQTFQVDTPPSVVVCEPVKISWNGGTAPYFLSFIPAGQASAPALKQFPQQDGTSFTWTADLAAGASFTIALKDSTGTTVFSDIVNVQSGPNSSCVNSSVTESGSGGAAGPTSAAGGSSVPAASGKPTETGNSSGANTKTPSSPSSTTSGAKATNTNAAYINRGNAYAVAGVMGLVGAALF